MAIKHDAEGVSRWTNDGRWGGRAGQVGHPGFVDFVEDLIDRGSLYVAFDHIRCPGLFYNLGWVKGCPERSSAPTEAELRHLTAYALRAAAQANIAITADGFWIEPPDTDDDDPDVLVRIQGLPLTEEIVGLLLYLILPPGQLRGEAQPNLALEVAIKHAVERTPGISNRALAKRLDVSPRTIGRYRQTK